MATTTQNPAAWTDMTPADWLRMTPADWLGITPSQWMDRVMPGWDAGGYGDLMRTPPSQWMTMMSASAQRAQPRRGRHHEGRQHPDRERRRHHDCGCDDCSAPRCECVCCIGDVDIVVYARLGERRVIPIVVENERRRDADISLELTDWTTRGGKAGPVQTASLDPEKFTLEACGTQKLTLVVNVRDVVQPANKESEQERDRLRDVDDCEVLTADLRLVGCDHRPVRLAVAVVPRDCDPSRIPCGCTCC